MNPPANPPIFHITHLENLRGIVREGGLWCDAKRIVRNVVSRNIGYKHIKTRRLACSVKTSAGGRLGDFVPFNFCSRSVMLFVIHKGHADYEGGQDEILHLVSSVERVTSLAGPWLFTDRHAELAYAEHFEDLEELCKVRWDVMGKRYWNDVREERQAEFLVKDFVPWPAIETIGVRTPEIAARVAAILGSESLRPRVTTRPDWYY